MVWPSSPRNKEKKRKNKITVAKISQLRVPLCFSFFVLSSHSPEKLAKSFEVKCRY